MWDVVDKSKKKKRADGLKLDNKLTRINEAEEESDEPALDAEFIDVYKGTNGVIMLFDMTKSWTYEYVQRELPKVPAHIPVLVLSNHRDMGHHRVVSEDQVRSFIEELGRSEGSGQVRYAEASMRNGFGLKFLHKFFNLPFLHLQRETLLRQLETNSKEITTTCEELDVLQETDLQNYDRFLNMITDRRRLIADQLSAKPVANGIDGPTRSISMPANLSSNGMKPNNGMANIIKPSPSIIIGANHPLPNANSNGNSTSKTSTAKAQSKASNAAQVVSLSIVKQMPSPKRNLVLKKVDDFVPDDETAKFRSFLEEPVEADTALDMSRKDDSGDR